MRVVRIVLGVVAALVVAGDRPLSGEPDPLPILAAVAGIVTGVVALNLVATLARRFGSIAISQVADVIGFVALAAVLDAPLDGRSWALLIVPIVGAGVRLSTAAAMLSWLGACALAFAVPAVGLHESVGLRDQLLSYGVLLAVAVAVGLLARWMREGWEIQNELTRAAVERERRAAVIEVAIRSLLDADGSRTFDVAADHVIELGFDAVTVHAVGHLEPTMVVGRSEILPDTEPIDELVAGEVLLTTWTDHDEVRAHSASVLEPNTRSIVTGWSTRQIDHGLANSLAALTAHLSVANHTKRIIADLRQRATRDPLTGLANRAGFDAELDARCAHNAPTSLMFLDLDDFKRINDLYGHSTGDIVLQAIASNLEQLVGDRGLVARFGGDEFVVLLHDDDRRCVEQVAEAMVRAGEDCIQTSTGRIGSRLSVGVAISSGAFKPAELVRSADAAMYRAKASGGGCSLITVLQTSDDDCSTAGADRIESIVGAN